ncbi:hypothetical protein ABPG77_002589 [Micractinium sp. CCAP 211/92]
MQSLRVLTFNISGANCSALAPPSFGLPAKYAAVAQLVLAEQPELVTLQEVFPEAAAPLAEALLLAGYEPCGSVESHCGYTQLWAEARLRARQYGDAGPVAIARIPLPLPGPGAGVADAAGTAGTAGAAGQEPSLLHCIFFAGCHLEPFADGAPQRLRQIEAALRAVPPRSRLVLAGDCNMRNFENAGVEALGLADAFQQLGRPQNANFSWNTRVNRYYGEETRAYTARYDRIYLRGLSAAELRLVADREHTPGRGDFLSDHFGLLATVDIPQQPPPSPAGRQQQPGGARQGRGPAQG